MRRVGALRGTCTIEAGYLRRTADDDTIEWYGLWLVEGFLIHVNAKYAATQLESGSGSTKPVSFDSWRRPLSEIKALGIASIDSSQPGQWMSLSGVATLEVAGCSDKFSWPFSAEDDQTNLVARLLELG
ncbi:hypothetical protein [Nocardia goodfellowii]|uniref:Uncharacterized protein n=1 Tax=Nocardia goodfellowii TaxID=882446 RepID=A0ABS4QHN1_9NOCA|nr:hypothetical protein [Nocardia goodfellowii]MBP2191202.1 hypothetical protein [Nocardia goodfellowii]